MTSRTVLELRGLEVECILGDLERERREPQTVSVDVDMEVGDRPSETDSLADAVDYAELCGSISELLKSAKCRLLERAARLVAEECASRAGVASATARVAKRGSVPGLASAAATFRADAPAAARQ